MAISLASSTTRKLGGVLAERQVTVESLSAGSGIPASTLHSKLGGSAPFELNELDAIAAALGLPLEEFLPCTAQQAGRRSQA